VLREKHESRLSPYRKSMLCRLLGKQFMGLRRLDEAEATLREALEAAHAMGEMADDPGGQGHGQEQGQELKRRTCAKVHVELAVLDLYRWVGGYTLSTPTRLDPRPDVDVCGPRPAGLAGRSTPGLSRPLRRGSASSPTPTAAPSPRRRRS
jgi:hypothetical protein